MTQIQSQSNKLIIIAGATAVGKSELSVQLAQQIGGQIISADSMQVYKGMDIGTAKITQQEMGGIRHYLIDELDPSEEFNVFEFQKRARQAIAEIYANGKIPILVGGTGFYIQAVLYDIDFSEEHGDTSYRSELEKRAACEGAESLHRLLQSIDPQAAEEIHPNNVKRVIRALEYYHETGQPISVHNRQQRMKRSPYDFTYIVLNRDRKEIYDRINLRVDKMIREGLVKEVENLLSSGIDPSCVSMQGLGYKEIVSYLQGDLTLEETSELLKKNTRHFAKRQITWFKREPDAVWMDYDDYEDISSMVRHIIQLANL